VCALIERKAVVVLTARTSGQSRRTIGLPRWLCVASGDTCNRAKSGRLLAAASQLPAATPVRLQFGAYQSSGGGTGCRPNCWPIRACDMFVWGPLQASSCAIARHRGSSPRRPPNRGEREKFLILSHKALLNLNSTPPGHITFHAFVPVLFANRDEEASTCTSHHPRGPTNNQFCF
jgi:hypothetical protein